MRSIFKIILNYIVYLNFIISISASLLISGIAHVFGLENNIEYGIFGFCSTFCVYNSQRLFKATLETETPWLKWVNKHKKLIGSLSFLSGLLACLFFVDLLNKITILIVLLIVFTSLISFFYVVRFGHKNIRELPYLKIHSIAITWTGIIVTFPIINENINDLEIFMFFVPAHYLYFIAVTIPFDIRDLKYDLPSQRTIPQVVGIKKSKTIAIVLLIITIIALGFLSNYNFISPIFLAAIFLQIILIVLASEKRKDVYYTVFIDGIIALLGISYLMM